MEKKLKAMTMERKLAAERLTQLAGKKTATPPDPGPVARKVRSNRHNTEPQRIRPVTV